MESIPIENDITFIHLPEVEKTEMEVVLQFLYTGKMKITKSLMKPVQKLLEEVLRIDINFKMPICEENSSLIVIYGMPEPNKGFQCRTR